MMGEAKGGPALGVGIVGTGFVAELHARAWARLVGGGAVLRGCASRRHEGARDFAATHGLPRAYASLEELLADPGIDIIDICVPNDAHRSVIIAAARAGKHIICEKPLTGGFGAGAPISPSGGPSRRHAFEEALANTLACGEAVRSAGVGFGYAENFVYAPPLAKARRLLEKAGGTIFDIRAEESHSGSHAAYARSWNRSGGGSLLRLGAHPVGAALHLKAWEGRLREGHPIRPAAVIAEVGNHTRIPSFQRESEKFVKTGWDDVEDWASAIITFEDGSHATVLSTDGALGGVRNSLSIFSSKAVLEVDINPNDALRAYTPRAGIFGDEYIQEKLETNGGWSFPAPDEDWIRGYDAEFGDFVSAFREGREPESGLALAEDTVKVIYAAYVAAEEGRRVSLA